jgi:SAM-dependent methyltransferase
VKAKRFLEVGCGLGYTAALMGEAGDPGCRVDTIEAGAEHADLASDHLSRRHLSDRVQILRGEAKDLLPTLAEPYDLVFLDADWEGFPSLLPPHPLDATGGTPGQCEPLPPLRRVGQGDARQGGCRGVPHPLVRDRRMVTFIVPEQWHAPSYRL